MNQLDFWGDSETASRLGICPPTTASFQLVSHRYEQGSTIITSDKSFIDLQRLFGNAVIATAIPDRLLHHCEVVNSKGHSQRFFQHAFSTQNLESQRAKELISQTN